MSMRSSAACLAWIALVTAAGFSQCAAARPPGLPLDPTVTCTPQPTGSFLLGVGVNSDAGMIGITCPHPQVPPPAASTASWIGPCACPSYYCVEYSPQSWTYDGSLPSPEYLRFRRELTDCLLFGFHPVTSVLRTRLLVEFDEEHGLPMVVVNGGHFGAGGVLLRAAEAAGCGCFHAWTLGRMCWEVLAEPRAGAAATEEAQEAPRSQPPAEPAAIFRPLGFINDLGAEYERLLVMPVEVEELPVPPVEIEALPVMPVEVELIPFLPPEIEVSAPRRVGCVVSGLQLDGRPVQRDAEPRAPELPPAADAASGAGGIPAPRPTRDIGLILPQGWYLRHPPQYLPPMPPFPLCREPMGGETDKERDPRPQKAERPGWGMEWWTSWLPPVDFTAARALEQLLTHEMGKLAAPRLIIEVEETPGSEEQEREHDAHQPDPPIFTIEPAEHDLAIGGGPGGTCCCETVQLLSRLVEQLMEGMCIDIDCSGGQTRARGQFHAGAFCVRLGCVAGRCHLDVCVLPEQMGEPAPALNTPNEWIIRSIEALIGAGAERTGTREESQPDRD